MSENTNMNSKKTRKKIINRCPNGTRRNPKTLLCEPILPVPDQVPVVAAILEHIVDKTNELVVQVREPIVDATAEHLDDIIKIAQQTQSKDSLPLALDKDTTVKYTTDKDTTVKYTTDKDTTDKDTTDKDTTDKDTTVKYTTDNDTSDKVTSDKVTSETGSCDYDLQKDLDGLDCNSENYYSNEECNKFLLKKEAVERNCINDQPADKVHLYPNINDANFNIKIATKKEFNDTKYDGEIFEDIEQHANELANADFELQPHQAFVKNFLSFQTPYNSLLLYHGLGTGKTCSAIGVCEEMRDYSKQTGFTKKIIIVASENVQDNFKSQLFDERTAERD